MIALPLETWVSLGSLLAVGLALFSQGRATRAELTSDMTELRAELRYSVAELKSDIQRVDDRVYALAAGLRPEIERVSEHRPRTTAAQAPSTVGPSFGGGRPHGS